MDEELLGGPSTRGRAFDFEELDTDISICKVKHGS